MNRQKFLKSLSNLSGWRESLFVLCLAERAMPNLVLYEDQLESGQASSFWSDVMNASWQTLRKKSSEEDIAELLDQVLEPVERLEEDDNYGALPSLDCLWLWEQALASELNPEVKRASEASQRSLQTVTQFLEFSEGQDLSAEALVDLFDKHDLVAREFSFQQEVSDLLRSSERLDEKLLVALRELAHDEGVSNIGISFD